jgi:Protein of unknown function (DUF2786)
VADKETVVDKVVKLLAKAESTNSEAEAEALYAKASDLITRHSIDQALLDSAAGRSVDEITEISFPLGSTYWQAWKSAGANVGAALGFKVSLDNRKNGRMWWTGWGNEVKPAEILWTNLMIQAERFAREYMSRYRSPYHHVMEAGEIREDRYKAKRSFLIGFGLQVANRIQQQRETTRREVSAEHGSSDLLPVLVSRDQRLDEYWDAKNLKKARSGKLSYNSEGFVAGMEAGDKADLGNRGMSGTRGSLGSGT